MNGKYQPLHDFLALIPNHTPDKILRFEQISEIISEALHQSAYIHRQRWENQTDNQKRPQAKAWMEAGFMVEAVDFTGRWVRFLRRGA